MRDIITESSGSSYEFFYDLEDNVKQSDSVHTMLAIDIQENLWILPLLYFINQKKAKFSQ